ncbi:transcription factor bHLH162 [Musa acuminata AAA Group]|uniref:transcription factor bHLH162 n=1 Tax=Musa acuminata AAA Group TaxID=214697 RepID=UPI0031DDCF14
MEASRVSARLDRKTVEKNRRIHMKALCAKLVSLLPASASQESVAATLPNQLDEAINYIKAMQETLERMKKRKKLLMWCAGIGKDEENTCLRVPKMEVQDLNSGLRVIAISSTCDHRLKFSEAVRIVEEAEGNEIITASYAVVGDAAFHTIESMATGNGIGEADKVLESLKNAFRAKLIRWVM